MLTVLHFTFSVKDAGGQFLLALPPVWRPGGLTTGCRVTTWVVSGSESAARFSGEPACATIAAPGGDCHYRFKIPQKCRSNIPHFRVLVTSQFYPSCASFLGFPRFSAVAVVLSAHSPDYVLE